jgi:glycosyltransferase 2 family protein
MELCASAGVVLAHGGISPEPRHGAGLKKQQWIIGLVVLAALAGLVVWARHRIHFDFGLFRAQVAQADWRLLVLATACIYAAYLFRAVRWAMLIRHHMRVPLFSLLGTQVMGFTAIALIGRVADPVRPYLVARKTGLPLSTQLAVYIVERLCDAGTMALLFSVAMIWVPAREVMQVTTAHSGVVARLAIHHGGMALLVARFGGLVLTVIGMLFLVAIRWAGKAVARFCEAAFGVISKKLGHAVAQKILAFHSGLDTMRTFSDFALTALLSIFMWLLIAATYFFVCRAFVASPGLAALSPSKCVLLMVASGSVSIFQLPVLGWFSQIALVAVILAGVFAVSPEAATACAAMLLLVSFLSVVPIGLAWAQFDHVNLRKITMESERAEEELGSDKQAADASAAP